jgi:GT2 family glycosyltransferase
MNKVVVIVPVYDGLEETTRCLDSLLASLALSRDGFDILVVNDASPNPKLVEYLEQYASNPGVRYLFNETNKGFVGTVNRGMREAGTADVVLLNSDTEVANDWLDRIKDCAYSDPAIGTVTPYCNNAEICSFPVFVKSNELPYGETTQSLDALFSRVGIKEVIDIPTAVGFCMYIKRDCLEKTGYFDEETFGRGYGEENDFCMRSAQRGFRHVLCQNVFVFHEGGVSFGPEKMKRVQRAMDTLDRLYPDYHEIVHQFVQADPSRSSRLRVYLEYLRSSCAARHKVLAITHNLGGGTERHIKELATYLNRRAVFLVLRAGQNGRFALSFGSDDSSPSMILTLPDDYLFLVSICRYIGVGRIHCHHIMGVDPSVWGLMGDLGVRMDVTLHDYYFINANPTLTDTDGEFCQDRLTRDAHCAHRYQLPGQASPEFWRYNQYNFLKQADRIFSPCEYTARLYKEYFPELSILPVYHPDWEEAPQYPPVAWPEIVEGKPLRIAVLGAVSKEKGADILDATARLGTRGDPVEFHLIGYAYRPLEPSIEETGPYKEEELEGLIREVNPHLVWFPCRWPETYSYTLSAALRAGLPVAAPDLGSFPERLHGRAASWIKGWKTSPAEWLDFFRETTTFLATQKTVLRQTPLVSAPAAFRYHSNYLLGAPLTLAEDAIIDWGVFSIKASTPHTMMSSADLSRPLDDDERLLVWLLKLRAKPAVYLLLKMLPFNAMQMFKRNLSERPIHEVMTRYQLHGGDLTLRKTVFPGLLRVVLRRRSRGS